MVVVTYIQSYARRSVYRVKTIHYAGEGYLDTAQLTAYDGSAINTYFRYARVDNNYMVFSDCYRASNNTVQNSFLIPMQIIGYK